MMSLEQKIRSLAEALITDDMHYIVDVSVKGTGQGCRVRILLDGDEGVTIDECAELSRAIGNSIEEGDLIDKAYNLEVSSPGVDFPLASERQYRKNVGRMLKIRTREGRELKGKLENAGNDSITVLTSRGKGKKKEEKEEILSYGEIEKAIVQISFK